MQIERKEFLLKVQDSKKEGNGYYERAFRSLRRNAMAISIPRTRSGGFSPLTMISPRTCCASCSLATGKIMGLWMMWW